MNYKKIVFLVSFIAVCGFLFNFGAPTAKAITAEELQIQIQALLQQITQLQQQLAQIQEKPAVWCHDFNTNLRIGDSGTEVAALIAVLQKEGGLFSSSDFIPANASVFEESTASAVVGFQGKYKSEVLTPWGLKNGTGFVGASTRAKLNKLYGCGVVTTPSITTLSPNGGEKLVGGQTHTIKWRSQNIDKVLIKLCALTPLLERGYTCHTLSGIPDAGIVSSGSFSWKVDPNDPFIPCDNACKIEIHEVRNGVVSEVFDASDNYFSIVAATATPSITVLSPNGGEQWVIGESHAIKINQPVQDSYPFTHITLNKLSGEEVGVIACKIGGTNQVLFDWSTQTVLNYCGAGLDNKIKTIEPGNYIVAVTKDTEGRPILAKSNTFSIVAASATPSITVTSPSGGSFQAGANMGIAWKQQGLGGKTVTLYLVGYDSAGNQIYAKSGYQVVGSIHKEYFIQGVLADVKGYGVGLASDEYGTSWTIPSDLSSRFESIPVKYKLGVWDRTYKGIVGASDNYFSIVAATAAPSITVTSPNGGEQWTMDSTQEIKWNVQYTVGFNTSIFLADGADASHSWKVGEVFSSVGTNSFKWAVGSATPHVNVTGSPPSSNYYIEVCRTVGSGGEDCDYSNAKFSIIAAATTCNSDVNCPTGQVCKSGVCVVSSGTGLKDMENQLADISSAVSALVEQINKSLGR